MGQYGFAILLNLILLPFYATKFPPRFLATWHLIPLLGAQLFFIGVLPLISQVTVAEWVSGFIAIPLVTGITSSVAFFSSQLARKDETVVMKQSLIFNISYKKILARLFLQYFSIPSIMLSAFNMIGAGLGPTWFLRNNFLLLSTSVVLYWFNRRRLRQLYAATGTTAVSEQPPNNFDYRYLAIPLGISFIASVLLSFVFVPS